MKDVQPLRDTDAISGVCQPPDGVKAAIDAENLADIKIFARCVQTGGLSKSQFRIAKKYK
ncbi:hypothetical protein [Desulfovibrio desulfuricans]|uniref:hypothetical protein n=1 Tax=Desulfovibrio desulfuricans TaxID=876 RepID=UPI0035B3A8B9